MAQSKARIATVTLFLGVHIVVFTTIFGGEFLDTPVFLLPLAAIPAGAVIIPYYLACAGQSRKDMPQQYWSTEAAAWSVWAGWGLLLFGTLGMNKVYGGDGGPRDTLMGYYLPKVLIVVAALYVGFVASLEAVDRWARIERRWAAPEHLDALDDEVVRLKRLRAVIPPAACFDRDGDGDMV